jgi:hypothetical protein
MKGIVLIFSLLLLTANVFAQPMNFTLGAFFQPGITSRIASYENQELKETFQTIRKNEKLDFGWEGGLAFHLYVSDYIHLESGITLSKKGYRALQTLDSLSFREPNDPVYTESNEINASHEFYFVSAPVRVGFTLYKDRVFAVGIRTGVNLDYHFLSIIRYEIIYDDHTENSVVRPEYSDFRKINLSGSLSIFGSYKLSDQYDIILEPHCSMSILPINKDTGVKSRFLSCGLRASLQYKF